MSRSVISVHVQTKSRLDAEKLVPQESYDHIINRFLDKVKSLGE